LASGAGAIIVLSLANCVMVSPAKEFRTPPQSNTRAVQKYAAVVLAGCEMDRIMMIL